MVARLAKHCHILCRSDDLIRSDEQGYYLREWITVRDAVDSSQKRVVAGDTLDRSRYEPSNSCHGTNQSSIVNPETLA